MSTLPVHWWVSGESVTFLQNILALKNCHFSLVRKFPAVIFMNVLWVCLGLFWYIIQIKVLLNNFTHWKGRWIKYSWLLLRYPGPERVHLLKECLTLNFQLHLLTPTWINWCLNGNVYLTHWKKSNCWFFLIEITFFDFFSNPCFRDSLKKWIYTKQTTGTLGIFLTQEISSI